MEFSKLDKWIPPRHSFDASNLPKGWRSICIGDAVSQFTTRESVLPDNEYKMAGVKWYAEGVFHRETVLGKEMSAKYVTPLVPGAVIYNRLFAWKESFAVVEKEHAGLFVSGEFPQFLPDTTRVIPEYLYLFCTRPRTIEVVNAASVGSAAVSRNRFKEEEFLKLEMPLPSLAEQCAIVERWRKAQTQIAAANERVEKIESRIPQMIYDGLGTPAPASHGPKQRLLTLKWTDLERWSVGYLNRARAGLLGFTVSRYPIVLLANHLVETMNGYCIKPVSGPTPFRMLKLNVLQPEGLDLSATKFVNVADSIAKRFCLHKDDLLICRSVGSYDMVAKCGVVEADAPDILFPDTIIRARLNPGLLPAYVREVMQTPLGRSHFQSNARTAVGMWKIGAEDIANFPIPVPPVEVQRKLVERVSAARAEMARERAAATALRQTIAAEVESLILGVVPLAQT